MGHSLVKMFACVVVSAVSVALLTGSVRAGGDSPAQDVVSAAEVEVQNLAFEFHERVSAAAARAVASITTNKGDTLPDHFKLISAAISKIERDAKKTSAKIQRIAERTLTRVVELGGDLSEVEQAEALQDTAAEILDSTYESSQAFIELLENRYDFLP